MRVQSFWYELLQTIAFVRNLMSNMYFAILVREWKDTINLCKIISAFVCQGMHSKALILCNNPSISSSKLNSWPYAGHCLCLFCIEKAAWEYSDPPCTHNLTNATRPSITSRWIHGSRSLQKRSRIEHAIFCRREWMKEKWKRKTERGGHLWLQWFRARTQPDFGATLHRSEVE